ncbi:tail fiber assembly protein [Pseudomonas sp. G2-4]|uniref:tail fiber assembly protein n=1 Tax=Pseudomonas sp. G2-4 TaxID=1506334 RepID=UPI0024B9E8E3|nr:tail fiber assembly protein [Pseudomonas sp. G2-4]WHS58610.1 tail fiber assembly protein [Pseudomonas sp. G2-4]
MPYATDGMVSSDVIEGGVEITDDQYRKAVEGMCNGMLVSVANGFALASPELPQLPDVNMPTEDELRASALVQRDQMLAVATTRMAPLQDAADLGIATDIELAALLEWKQYRVALNRIQMEAGFPTSFDWPTQPS